MRRVIRNFNFKLDFDEIDRIIEEDDGNVAASIDTTVAAPKIDNLVESESTSSLQDNQQQRRKAWSNISKDEPIVSNTE
jgi:hypothetical protein